MRSRQPHAVCLCQTLNLKDPCTRYSTADLVQLADEGVDYIEFSDPDAASLLGFDISTTDSLDLKCL